MQTLSTRVLSALAFDRGEEYDPAQPICPSLLEDLEPARARRPGDRRARTVRARPPTRPRTPAAESDPAWFSAEDLITAPWETAGERFV
ncbi:MAG: hypothetical protein WBP81_06190 [Solirubrobacteraceae bacterium]